MRPNSGDETQTNSKSNKDGGKKKPKLHSLDDVFKCVMDQSSDSKNNTDKKEIKVELKHFIRK